MGFGFEKKKIKKDELRAKHLDILKHLSNEEIQEKSEAIQKRFIGIVEYSEADTIMYYYSSEREVQTRWAIEQSIKDGKRVILPSIDIENRTIKPVLIKNLSKVKPGPYEIMEPVGEPANIDEVDIIIVPVVAFDAEGDRIGRGLAYYDRFLRGLKMTKVAFAFDCQRTDNIPREEHDQTVDKIVTESRVIVAKK